MEYAETLSLTSEYGNLPRPAPETPDLASTIRSGATRPAAERGSQRQDRGRRVAARIGHDLRSSDLAGVDLRQAVDGALEVARARVVDLIPLAILLHVAQAEVGTDVHCPDAVVQDGTQALRAGGMRQGREDEVDAAGQVLGDRQVDGAEMGDGLTKSLAGGAPACDRGYLHLGVAVQDARKLHAGVACDVDDSDLHFDLHRAAAAFGRRALVTIIVRPRWK